MRHFIIYFDLILKLIFTCEYGPYRKGHYCCRIVCTLTTLRLFMTLSNIESRCARKVRVDLYEPTCTRQLRHIATQTIFGTVPHISEKHISEGEECHFAMNRK